MKGWQCPKCHGYLPIRWVLFSFNWTTCKCSNCGSVLKWTKRRTLLAGLSGGFSGSFVVLSSSIIPSIWLRIAIAMVVAMALAFFVPNQIALAYENEL
ncbi:hypothetical protein [Vibrio diabolicus]|uniref:hypothetical protein n=1 Tax=Vibrio diabolicus TaxID=50719 RepID=UPI003D7EDD0F